jgi:hypothetical protein
VEQVREKWFYFDLQTGIPMTDRQNNIIAFTFYKTIALLSGTAFGYMGFRLFMAGIFEKAGELEQLYGKEHLLLKQAAPGTFFALFGCAIILVTLMRGFRTETDSSLKPVPISEKLTDEGQSEPGRPNMTPQSPPTVMERAEKYLRETIQASADVNDTDEPHVEQQAGVRVDEGGHLSGSFWANCRNVGSDTTIPPKDVTHNTPQIAAQTRATTITKALANEERLNDLFSHVLTEADRDFIFDFYNRGGDLRLELIKTKLMQTLAEQDLIATYSDMELILELWAKRKMSKPVNMLAPSLFPKVEGEATKSRYARKSVWHHDRNPNTDVAKPSGPKPEDPT